MRQHRPTMDPRILRDERFGRLSAAAKLLWYHLAFSCPHMGLSLEEICRGLVELGDPELLGYLCRYAMPHHPKEGAPWPSGERRRRAR
ncbi:MAG: hypothetical protein N0A24_07310 [Armatimonadetes bacterium]|nr:hypothetical protein [Armatimonadota bacterium]MDW8154010.1 hypothetical protein [Armatimonadota bacterium]